MTVTITTTDCCSCGVPFGMSETLHRSLRDKGATFYCPNGHPQVYREPTVKLLERKLAAEEAKRKAAESDAAVARVQRDEAKVETRKLRERIVAGACPCCTRHFKQLARHLATKHEAFVSEIEAARKARTSSKRAPSEDRPHGR